MHKLKKRKASFNLEIINHDFYLLNEEGNLVINRCIFIRLIEVSIVFKKKISSHGQNALLLVFFSLRETVLLTISHQDNGSRAACIGALFRTPCV